MRGVGRYAGVGEAVLVGVVVQCKDLALWHATCLYI